MANNTTTHSQFIKCNLHGASGKLRHATPVSKLQNAIPTPTDSNTIHAVKCFALVAAMIWLVTLAIKGAL